MLIRKNLWYPMMMNADGGTAAPSEGTPNPSAPTPLPSGTPSQSSWWSGLPADYHANVNVTRYGSQEEFVKGALSLQQALGSDNPSVRVKAYAEANAGKPEALASVYEALGRPAKPEDYGLKVSENAPEWMGKFATDLTTTLHPLGATKAQIEATGKLMEDTLVGVLKAENDARAAAIAATEQALQQKFGDKFPAVKQNVQAVLGRIAGDKAAELGERLNQHFGDMPFIFEALAQLGAAQAEPGAPVPPGGAQASIGGYGNKAEAEAALGTLEADPAFQKAMLDKAAPDRKGWVDKRWKIIEAIDAFDKRRS